ncbi:hypothetical protein TAF16_0576 [Anoxybacillus flavithermus]|uniref:Uncharacterized protein n=1 Tax=Anoxybacillus flavithermus TaxID=33934 RepID=A0A178TJX4_9BACL|nr:hypothetical protein TAF16_0576 [Anoxybacillus flavithermus]
MGRKRKDVFGLYRTYEELKQVDANGQMYIDFEFVSYL